MQRITGLLRDTWWLWLAFFSAAVLGASFVDIVFLAAIPICVVTMVYFASVRYDEHGRPRR
jgi:hypothetical protein